MKKSLSAFFGTLGAAATLVYAYQGIRTVLIEDLRDVRGQTQVFASLFAVCLGLAFTLACFRSAFAAKATDEHDHS